MEAVDPTVFRLAIFVLAIFVGYYVVWSVTPALHTPLMSVTNAISSVIVVGALLAAAARVMPGDHAVWISKGAGAVAAALASVNIFGGFLVTQRMLSMYQKKERRRSERQPRGRSPIWLSGVLFILALRGLSSPVTSRRGNLLGMIGMALAIATALATLAAQGRARPGHDRPDRWAACSSAARSAR